MVRKPKIKIKAIPSKIKIISEDKENGHDSLEADVESDLPGQIEDTSSSRSSLTLSSGQTQTHPTASAQSPKESETIWEEHRVITNYQARNNQGQQKREYMPQTTGSSMVLRNQSSQQFAEPFVQHDPLARRQVGNNNNSFTDDAVERKYQEDKEKQKRRYPWEV